MFPSAMRAEAHRMFLGFAPAVLAAEGDWALECAALARPGVAAYKQRYDELLRALAQHEAQTYEGALALSLSSGGYDHGT